MGARVLLINENDNSPISYEVDESTKRVTESTDEVKFILNSSSQIAINNKKNQVEKIFID